MLYLEQGNKLTGFSADKQISCPLLKKIADYAK